MTANNEKIIDHEMYDALRSYNKTIEASLRQLTEKLELRNNEFLKLKSEHEIIAQSNEILVIKLKQAEQKIIYLEKKNELIEQNNNKINRNAAYDDSSENAHNCEEDVRGLNEKMKLEQNKNLSLKLQLAAKEKEVFDLNHSLKVALKKEKTVSARDNNWLKIDNEEKSEGLREKSFIEVISGARLTKKADSINKTKNVDKEFEQMIIKLVIDLIDKREYKSYADICDYLRDQIRSTLGHYYLVTVGKFDCHNSSSWSITGRKTLSFKINELCFAIYQITTELKDLLNVCKLQQKVEIISKNENTDTELENCVADLALEVVGKDFNDYQQMSDFMANSISKRFRRHWLVVIGVYDNYDLCFNISNNYKRKFIEVIIKDLRFTVFQAS